jgi:hypothetical protein
MLWQNPARRDKPWNYIPPEFQRYTKLILATGNLYGHVENVWGIPFPKRIKWKGRFLSELFQEWVSDYILTTKKLEMTTNWLTTNDYRWLQIGWLQTDYKLRDCRWLHFDWLTTDDYKMITSWLQNDYKMTDYRWLQIGWLQTDYKTDRLKMTTFWLTTNRWLHFDWWTTNDYKLVDYKLTTSWLQTDYKQMTTFWLMDYTNWLTIINWLQISWLQTDYKLTDYRWLQIGWLQTDYKLTDYRWLQIGWLQTDYKLTDSLNLNQTLSLP